MSLKILKKKKKRKERKKVESQWKSKKVKEPYEFEIKTDEKKRILIFTFNEYGENSKYNRIILVLYNEPYTINQDDLKKDLVRADIFYQKSLSKKPSIMVHTDYMDVEKYEDVLLDVQVECILNNEAYRTTVFKYGLDIYSVRADIENGLKEKPSECPNGNYILRISGKDGSYYVNDLDPGIGEIVHNSPEMKEKRMKDREEQKKREDDFRRRVVEKKGLVH